MASAVHVLDHVDAFERVLSVCGASRSSLIFPNRKHDWAWPMLLGDCDIHKWWVQKGGPVTCWFSRIKYDQSTEKLANVLGTDVVTFGTVRSGLCDHWS